MEIIRESILWRFDGRYLHWLICLPELVKGHTAEGWKPLCTIDEAPPNDVEEVRQAEEQRWTPEVERRRRWRIRRRRRPPIGSTGE